MVRVFPDVSIHGIPVAGTRHVIDWTGHSARWLLCGAPWRPGRIRGWIRVELVAGFAERVPGACSGFRVAFLGSRVSPGHVEAWFNFKDSTPFLHTYLLRSPRRLRKTIPNIAIPRWKNTRILAWFKQAGIVLKRKPYGP